MKKRDFIVVFSSLKAGKHVFEYSLDATFFAQFANPETEGFQKAEIILEFVKTNLTMEMNFTFSGLLSTNDDDSGEHFELPTHNAFRVVVKFGEAFDDTDPEILVLPQGEYELDVSQYLYELAVLSIPLRKSKNEIKN